jgi:macrolide transport system ATP-binding/permease protein
MRLADILSMRLRSVFKRKIAEDELDEELRYHLQREIEENVAAGMSAGEARRAALLSMGGLERRKDECRDMRGLNLFDNLRGDVRFALRQLRKSPGFTVTAVLVLTLGIGASVATFGLVDATLLEPLPYRDSARLVSVYETAAVMPRSNLSYPDYVDWKRQNQVLASLDIFSRSRFLMSTREGRESVRGARVTAGFFRTLGVTPVLGRDFNEGEDALGAPRMAVLSYPAWQNRFGGKPSVLGQTLILNDSLTTIVGVLPANFHFAPGEPSEFWTTFNASTECDLRRGCHAVWGIGRLKEGVSVETAEASLKALAKSLEAQYPDTNRDQGAALAPLRDVIVGDIRPVVLLLMAGAILLVVIAGVNVASLLLVRSDTRRREIAVRSALGASAKRLMSQFATEGSVLVLCGGAAGLIAGSWSMQFIPLLIPARLLERMPFLRDLGLNVRIVVFAGAIALITAVAFALTPVLRGSLSQMRAGLAESTRGSAGLTWRRMGAKLVVLELAIAMVLLVGAGLLSKSLQRLLDVELGFKPHGLAVVEAGAPLLKTDPQKLAMGRDILSRVTSLPGVESTALASRLPLDGNGNTDWIRFEGRPWDGVHTEVNQRDVSAAYFMTIKARLIRGRSITDADDESKPRVVVINQTLAEQYFPGEDPIGKRIGDTSLTPASMKEIVGVVEDIREGTLEAEVWPAVYYSFNQSPDNFYAVVTRTSQSEESMVRTIGDAIHQIGPEVVTTPGMTMIERIRRSDPAHLRRSSAWLVGAFAGLAFVMSVVGLYGVVAYSVSQRTREIGVRMALGAERGSVYGLVLKEAAVLTFGGVVAGLVGSVGAANLSRKMLFGVEPWDASTLAVVAGVLAASAMLASYLPARRAASVNPVNALRAE